MSNTLPTASLPIRWLQPPSKSFIQVQTAINERYNRTMTQCNDQIAREQQNTQRELLLLHERTMSWMTTGIADFTPQSNNWINVKLHGIGWGQRGFLWSRYIRELCREQRRPYVTVTNTSINVPKYKYTQPLVATFLLMAEDTPGTRWDAGGMFKMVPVTRHHGRVGFWEFNFWGPEGLRLLAQWREQCRVDPVFRAALRLP